MSNDERGINVCIYRHNTVICMLLNSLCIMHPCIRKSGSIYKRISKEFPFTSFHSLNKTTYNIDLLYLFSTPFAPPVNIIIASGRLPDRVACAINKEGIAWVVSKIYLYCNPINFLFEVFLIYFEPIRL